MLRMRVIGLLILMTYVGNLQAIIGAMYGSHIYDIAFRPIYYHDKTWAFGVLAERGVSTKAYNEFNCVSSALRIWSPDQNALKMLYGFPTDSAEGQLLASLDAADNGVRGHFCVNGNLNMLYNVELAGRYHFCQDFFLGAYLPIRGMELSNVCWADQTLNIEDQDRRVKTLLTNNLFANVAALGGPCLQNWRRTGFGDLVVLLEWQRDFPQNKPFLKNARLNGRLGISIPTGLKQNEDLLFAVPFGNDGAMGVVFGGGLDLTIGCFAKAGFDVNLLHLFGNARNRRIKTNVDQTELLLLEKTCAYIDWGLTQEFNLYFQFWQFYKGLSFKMDYQYKRHGEDTISLETQAFSTAIANSAQSLEEWTTHYGIFNLSYDFAYHLDDNARVKPQLSLFAKVPLDGKRAVLFATIGIEAMIDF